MLHTLILPRKCIFLGYGTETKGYRLYDPNRARMFYSRDVLFNEEKYQVEEPSVQEEKHYVEFNFPSDCDDDRPNEEETVTERPTEPVLRRSRRERRPPDYYVEQSCIANDHLKEPATVEEALVSPDKVKWLNAMEKEMDSLHANDVWNLVELPEDRKAVGSKCVFKLKVGADGSVERHRARLVAQGFSQKFGPGCSSDSSHL